MGGSFDEVVYFLKCGNDNLLDYTQVVRIAGRMAFMNAAQLQDHLTSLVDNDQTPYKDIVFDCAGKEVENTTLFIFAYLIDSPSPASPFLGLACIGVSSIDLTAIIALVDVLTEAEKHDIRLWFANVCKQLKSNLTMAGLIERLGGEQLCVRTIEEVRNTTGIEEGVGRNHIKRFGEAA